MRTRLLAAVPLALTGCADSVPWAPLPTHDTGVLDVGLVSDGGVDTGTPRDGGASDASTSPRDGGVDLGPGGWQPVGSVGHRNTGIGYLAPLSGTYDETNALFTLESYDGSARLVTQSAGDYISIEIAASDDRFFVPGIYLGAVRYPFQTGLAPGISLGGMGRGCNEVAGSFVVRELARNRVGVIERLRYDYVHDCEGSPQQRTTGTVWWHATGVDDPVPAHPEDCAVDPITGFCVASPAGDTIGRGRMIAPDRRDGTFSWVGSPSGLVVRFTGEFTFGFRFSPPTGASLAPGTYPNASATSTPSQASMAVGDGVSTVNSTVCIGVGAQTGSFQIHELTWDGATLTRLSADVVQSCLGAPAMHAKIRYTAEPVVP